MNHIGKRETKASKVGRVIAVPFKVEAALWHALQPSISSVVAFAALKWSARAIAVLALAYYLLPLLLLVMAIAAGSAVLASLHSGSSSAMGEGSLVGSCTSTNAGEPGVRTGIHGYGRYDVFGNREYDN